VRFISMVKTAEGGPPSPELMGAIGKLAQELGQSVRFTRARPQRNAGEGARP
jgi:hypothetical protein